MLGLSGQLFLHETILQEQRRVLRRHDMQRRKLQNGSQ